MQDICVTATRDHNVYASFRPSIATKDAETHSKMNTEPENGNVDGQTNRQKNGRNYTNFERNLALMVIYLPVKFEFDWTKHFQVRVQKQKC